MPQVSKQIIKDVIKTLDSYGCGAHHPDLLPLLAQPEGQPVAYMNPDDLCADTAFRWCKLGVFTEPLYTHPAPFTPITADDVTDEMLKAIKKETPMHGVVTNERVVAIYNAVNAYMGSKK
jgi:hypothetical protein